MTYLTYYNRIEPRSRDNDFVHGLAAEIRDPLWMMMRQWQVGEFRGEDTGSLAYITYSGGVSQLPRWRENGNEHEVLDKTPLEPQTLREPFHPDLTVRVELAQDFTDILAANLGDNTLATQLTSAFQNVPGYRLVTPTDGGDFDPPDPATVRFMTICGDSVDGFALYGLAQRMANGTDSVPGEVTTDLDQVNAITKALGDLKQRVEDIFGVLAEVPDPATWVPKRLEYQLSVVAADPSGQGNVELTAYPNSEGDYEWYSFDAKVKDTSAAETKFDPVSQVEIPARVRFPGMPSTRFWNFEENTLAIPDVKAGTRDLVKLLALDFMMLHSHDWFRIPYLQEPGTVARTDHILVHDVFGRATVVRGANSAPSVEAEKRWSLFSVTDYDPPTGDPPTKPNADYFILPLSGGVAMRFGSVLEDVRIGRDEMANMAWGIELVTTSPIGEPRSGRERDAQIDAKRQPRATTPTGTGYPLRYQIESEVPANFIPLFPQLADPSSGDPSILLRRGQAFKLNANNELTKVPFLSATLNPGEAGTSVAYDIEEDEIPRTGLRLERVVCRTRWVDGSTHLWVQRRRRIGAGEAQSGLQFDQSLPNEG